MSISPSLRSVRRAVPRLIAAGVMPSACFIAGRATAGLLGAVIASLTWGLTFQLYLRWRGKPFSVLVGLYIAELVVRSAISLSLGSTSAFFITPSVVTAAVGLAYLLSCVLGRPLLALIAEEVLPGWLVGRSALRRGQLMRRASLCYGAEQVLVAGLSVAMALLLRPTDYLAFHPVVSWSTFWVGAGIFALTCRVGRSRAGTGGHPGPAVLSACA